LKKVIRSPLAVLNQIRETTREERQRERRDNERGEGETTREEKQQGSDLLQTTLRPAMKVWDERQQRKKTAILKIRYAYMTVEG
jgi:hypothetical protein